MESPRSLPFSIDLTPGAESVRIDGQDFTTSVRALSLVAAAGQVPIIRLEVASAPGAAVFEGVGVVQVVTDAPEESDIVRAWLARQDADILASTVLNEGGWSDKPMAVALNVLQRWASGTP